MYSLQFKLSLTGLLIVGLASGAALCFASSHPGLRSITVAGVLCVSAIVLAGWILFRFDGNASHKEASNGIQHTAKPPAATGLDQRFIEVLGPRLRRELSRLGEEALEDYR